MKGELLWIGCEKGGEDRLKVLELWTFPDGTLNILAVTDHTTGVEHSFPVGLERLEGVLRGKPVEFFATDVVLRIRRCETMVCAECVVRDRVAKQCVSISEFEDVISRARARCAYAI